MTSTGYGDSALLYWGDIDFTTELVDFAEPEWVNGDFAEEYDAPAEGETEISPFVWPDHSGPVGVGGWEAAPPGVELACRLAGVEHDRLDDDGLLDVVAAWRRLGAWVKAGELAAVAAFMDRATASTPLGPGADHLDQAAGQIQTGLHLTGRATDALIDLAGALHHHLPGTGAALACGVIDEARAQVIARGTAVLTGTDLPDGTLHRLEAQILSHAAEQTTGELRASVARAVIEIDPGAAERRRRDAEARRRVELRPTDEHTADLCGRDLPAAQALAADARITALAKALKTDGTPGTLAMLRAQVYLALLLGTCPTPTWPPTADLPDHPDDNDPYTGDNTNDIGGMDHLGTDTDRGSGEGTSKPGDGPDGEDNPEDPEGSEEGPGGTPRPGPTGPNSRFGSQFGAGARGQVHVIVPIGTLLGTNNRPGEVPAYGPVPATIAQMIAAHAAGGRWRYTLVDITGRAISAGHLRHHPDDTDYRRLLSDITNQAANPPPGRDHHTRSASGPAADAEPVLSHAQGPYQPGRALQSRVENRDRRCRFPGCRHPAHRCDLDHTIPYHHGGVTCECNLATLCRRHHQLKQAQGWKLDQPEPGTLIWTTPTGRQYRVQPDPYPT